LPPARDDGCVAVARLHAHPGVVGTEGRVHLQMEVLARRPRPRDVERLHEAEGPAVYVVGRAADLVVDRVSLDPTLGERLTHDRVEDLRCHAVIVARHHGRVRVADDGDVAEPAHRRWMNDASGASGSPVGRQYRMSSWSPWRSPSGFQTASTRMPMRTCSGGHS